MRKPKIPNDLSSEAKKIWKKLIQEYGISDAGGLEILRTGLQARDKAAEARKIIEEEGLVLKDRWFVSKPHPLIPCARDMWKLWLASLRELQLDVEPLKDGPGRPPGR